MNPTLTILCNVEELGTPPIFPLFAVVPLEPAPRRTLKKLLDRIRSQRKEWTEHSRHAPAADSPTAVADEIPERDTTIDTGSLTSEEKDKELPTEPTELPEPSHSPAGKFSTVITCNEVVDEGGCENIKPTCI